MLRFIILIILVVIYLTVTIPFEILALLISFFNRRAAMKIGKVASKFGFTVAKLMAGVDVTYLHDENVPQNESVLYVGNHRSYYDIILTQIHCKDLLGFVAKKELAFVPSLNVWMYFINCKFIDRKDMKQSFKVLTEMCEDVISGKASMMIFPEGTRNRGEEGTVLKFHDASLKMAAKAGCTIVPVALSNTQSVFEARFPALTPSKVIIEYGEPIRTAELSAEERKKIGETVKGRIETMLKSHEGMF